MTSWGGSSKSATGTAGRRIDYDGLGNPVRITVDRAGQQETIQAVFDGTGLLSSVVITGREPAR